MELKENEGLSELIERIQLVKLEGRQVMTARASLRTLLIGNGVHFILVEWPTRDLPNGEADGVFWCDLSGLGLAYQYGSEADDEKEIAEHVRRIEERVIGELSNAGERALVCLLPTLADADRDKPVFDRLRGHFFGMTARPRTKAAVFVGDLPTWCAANQEIDKKSTFGKEIANNIWLVDGYDISCPAIRWLSGGDPDLAQELDRRRGEPNLTPAQALRSAVYTVATRLMTDNQPGSLESRLRRALGAPPAPHQLRGENSFRHATFCARLRRLLPGVLPDSPKVAAYELRRDDLRRARAESTWHGLSALDTTFPELGLLAAGLLGFGADDEGGDPYLQIRSPLFAYAASLRASATAGWASADSQLRDALSRRLLPPEGTTLTGLDQYLNRLLELADPQMNIRGAWLVPPPKGIALIGKPGDPWWDRFPAWETEHGR